MHDGFESTLPRVKMAELVDARASSARALRGVQVQILLFTASPMGEPASAGPLSGLRPRVSLPRQLLSSRRNCSSRSWGGGGHGSFLSCGPKGSRFARGRTTKTASSSLSVGLAIWASKAAQRLPLRPLGPPCDYTENVITKPSHDSTVCSLRSASRTLGETSSRGRR